jgi:uncharacterized protein (DUF58 family)
MVRVSRLELRLRLPIVWLVLLVLAAVLLPGRIWNTMLIGLGGLFLVAYIWARQLAKGLRGRRQLRFGWVAVGDRLSEQFEVHNSSWLPALWVEVLDESNVPGYQAAVVRSLEAAGYDHWRQSAVCVRRGQFHLGPWALRTADPFGIFRVTVSYPAQTEIIIHPPVRAHLPIPLPSGQSSGRARAHERSWQATINAAGVRGYHPHDPFTWIHWPTTARRNELHVRQFDLDTAGDIWLALDLQGAVQLGISPENTEEQAVLLAASLSAQALQQSRAVGLAAYGREPQVIPPGRGQGQQWKMLRALALAQANGENNLSAALRDLARTAQRGAAALIITPNGEADWLPDLLHLARVGIRSSVVLLDRPSFGGEGNSEKLRQAINQLGFTAYVVKKGDVALPAGEEERRGFWEFKVLATGKVVTVRSPMQGK